MIDLIAAAHEVMRENGFEPGFPPEVEREVRALEEPAPAEALASRPEPRDLRALVWSSIDNRESRDLDQLEVAERLPNGHIRLRIAIADVDALVRKGSATDERAAENTTSVYTGVAVFPMLPEKLSTDLTSLNEREDRLAMVTEMDIAADGTVAREAIYRALVHNHAKLDYERVGDWLEGEGPLPPKAADVEGLEAQLRLQQEAAQRLVGLRRRRGAVYLDTVEARPVTKDGKVIDIQTVERNPARDLIENFMVAANEAMARWLEDQKVVSIRRVVRTPRRWDKIVELAADLGETLPRVPDGVALGEFLVRRRVADPVHYPDLALAVVKLLGPGEYVLERRFEDRPDEDHFGLAAAEYAHSTAPNRRFPDLVTQRLAKAALLDTPIPYTHEELDAIARRCTQREDAARKVERTMRKMAAATMLQDQVGRSYDAVVTGAKSTGTYVRVLRPPIEGRVVRGEEGLDVGDVVRVTLIGADPEKGFIDFAHGGGERPRKRERTREKRRAAMRLAGRLGDRFDAEVTGVTPRGTWVRLLDVLGDGRVVRGAKGLEVGDRTSVRLAAVDPVHGFIDFEREDGAEAHKVERRRRKQAAARRLRHRIGDGFAAEVTGVTDRATWIRLTDTELDGHPVEGRLVRGGAGLAVGDPVGVILVSTDPARGYIDFAREG